MHVLLPALAIEAQHADTATSLTRLGNDTIAVDRCTA